MIAYFAAHLHPEGVFPEPIDGLEKIDRVGSKLRDSKKSWLSIGSLDTTERSLHSHSICEVTAQKQSPMQTMRYWK
jgi:hypothetical protein